MDSRDVTAEPTIKVGFLESMYGMQKSLVDHYVGIEGLPPYPVDVNTKSSQILLKDFTSRVIEELAEAFEAMQFVSEATEKNKLWFGEYDHSRYNSMLNHLQNVGEEFADALHFNLELLIYANIQPEDVVEYSKKILSIGGKQACSSEDSLKCIMVAGVALLQTRYNYFENPKPTNVVDLLKPISDGDHETDIDSRFFLCGSKYSLEFMSYHKQILWDITYHLNISRNFLKNKAWKQSSVMTQESQYQEQLVLAFIILVGYMGILGCNPGDVYFLYFKKNHVNQFRIKSQY